MGRKRNIGIQKDKLLMHYWHQGRNSVLFNRDIWKNIEVEAREILKIEGFENIKYCSGEIANVLPFDYVATKNKEKHVIEITSGYNKRIKKHIIFQICKLLDAKYSMLFIKPDLTIYKIYEDVDTSKTHFDVSQQGYFKQYKSAAATVNPCLAIISNIITHVNLEGLQPNTVDLKIKKISKIFEDGELQIGKSILPRYIPIKTVQGKFELESNTSYSVEFEEFVNMPPNMIGYIMHRSSLNRMGTSVMSGIYDSGFCNYVGAILRTTSKVKIQKGARIATFLLMWADAASKYCGQFQGKHLIKKEEEQ